MIAVAATPKPTIHMVEDHEGDGRCSACEREGLRWVALLSDGSRVGLECAKAITGRPRPPRTQYVWQTDFELVATYLEAGQVMHGLWQHRRAAQTRWTIDGVLQQVGGARADWQASGWI